MPNTQLNQITIMKRQRLNLGYSIDTVAKAAGVSWSAYFRYENKMNIPPVTTALKIASTLKMHPKKLYEDFV